MPNLNFYAIDEDYEQILNFIFTELDCRAFESYSKYENNLIEFKTAQEAIQYFDLKSFSKARNKSALIMLWPTTASQNVQINKIKLDPKRCNGATYRFSIDGWGLINLYLKGINEDGLQYSNTNHNSEKRALNWQSLYSDKIGSPNSWNWKEVSRISRKLNNFIKKNAPNKVGALHIMNCASKFKLT